MEEHSLDLNKRHWSFSRHGLTLIGTWVRLDGRWRPCMAIIRTNHPEFQPCVIPLERAWQWSDAIGEPMRGAYEILPRLGVDPTNLQNVHKLIALVNSRMHDLVTMPPRPPAAEYHAEAVADVTLNNAITGKTEVSL